MQMWSSRIFLRFAVLLVVVWLVACTVIGVVAVEMAMHPGLRPLEPQAEDLARTIAARNQASVDDVSVVAADSASLRAWNLRPSHGNGNAVILLHGQSDNRVGMLGYAELLLRHGYAVLLPDARAHGQSGGDVATYGVLEADDMRRWFDWVTLAEAPRCVYGLGESMGAAQLLASLRVEPGFCAAVAESPFASFREASYDRLGERLGACAWVGQTLLRPAVEAGFLYARWRYGVDFARASPEDSVAASEVPVLLIHGLKDTNLPPRNSELILAASASRSRAVVLWEPAEAGHTGAASAEPQEFERRVIGWFEGHGPR